MKDIVRKMLQNEISMKDFIDRISNNIDCVSFLNSYIPESAKNNPDHELWIKFSYDAMRLANFQIWEEIRKIAKFDNSIGDNLNIFGIINYFYSYFHPDFISTTKYDDEYDLYLDIAGDTYGGPEVDKVVEAIVLEYASIKSKTKRKREAKEKIRNVFHVCGKKQPHWINGAEWPMGVLSPMKFVDVKSIKEGKIYRFCDFDTGSYRDIKQFY